MREIKFRAWDLTEREMVAGFYVRADGDIYWENDDGDAFPEAEPNNLIVMQFTGMRDKNGKEIYEGDVCRYGDAILPVVWREDWGGFALKGVVWYYVGGDNCPREIKPEVIGNIHEHPELLK